MPIPTFIIYNVQGISIIVDAEVGRPFEFYCPIEECGQEIKMQGVIIKTSMEEFKRILNVTPKVFSELEISSPFIFKGKINGKETKLPAESIENFTKRFMKEVFVITK